MDHIRAWKSIQLLLDKMHTRHRTTTRGQMRTDAAEVDNLFDTRCTDSRYLVPAHLVDKFLPVRCCKMGWHHGINSIRTPEAISKKPNVFDPADKRFCAGRDNSCAPFRVRADDADMMARFDQLADQW